MAEKKRSLLRNILRKALFVGYVSVAALLLFEVVYRYQWFDSYAAEFEALNENENADRSEQEDGEELSILVCGDSFSATPQGWVSELRSLYPEHQFINAAVPGTGIRETLILAPDRIEQFQPDVFIYQVYVGNDLFDIDRPTNWSDISIMRNVFWSMSDVFLSLRLVNYKIGQYSSIVGSDSIIDVSKDAVGFDPKVYNAREKVYWDAEPSYFEKAIFLHEDVRDEFEELTAGIKALKAQLPEGCQMYVLVIPHAAQLDEKHFNRTAQVFSGFPLYNDTLSRWTQDIEWPFQSELRTRLQAENTAKVVDALSLLRYSQSENSGPYYYANDPHLTLEGQRVVAYAVGRQLRYDQGWQHPDAEVNGAID
jgi:hypothetical protein